jgi:uncharacterized protein
MEKSIRVVIAGGSGLIGRKLIEALLSAQHETIVLSRSPERAGMIFPSAAVQFWDGKTSDGITHILEGTDAVINLSGESIAARRWTRVQKERILSSRIQSTQALLGAIKQTKRKPSVLLNASAVGYYGNVPDGGVTESSSKGEGYLADVCDRWEAEALKAQELGVRTVLLRTGIVLDKKAGTLQKLLLPFRFFIGGPLGSGAQWFPWIHLQDEVRAILFALENEQLSGPLNLAAPGSVRVSEFCGALGKIIRRPSWIHAPASMLKLALGEMAEPLVLHGQRVMPEKLVDAGFKFDYPVLEDALRDLFL